MSCLYHTCHAYIKDNFHGLAVSVCLLFGFELNAMPVSRLLWPVDAVRPSLSSRLLHQRNPYLHVSQRSITVDETTTTTTKSPSLPVQTGQEPLQGPNAKANNDVPLLSDKHQDTTTTTTTIPTTTATKKHQSINISIHHSSSPSLSSPHRQPPSRPRDRDTVEMASDADYASFLDKANQDTSTTGNVSASSTANKKNQQSGFAVTKAVDTEVPVSLQGIDRFYTSDTDERFEPVSLSWEGEGLPDESQ